MIIEWYDKKYEHILTPKIGFKVTAADKNPAWEELTTKINAQFARILLRSM